MTKIKSPPPLISLLLGASLALIPLSGNSQSVVSVSFNPPPGFSPPPGNDGEPPNTGAGGRRGGQCFSEAGPESKLTPLTPANQLGLTLDKNPSIFVFVPKTTAIQGEFLLRVPTENPEPGQPKFREVYYTTFDLPSRPGIVRIQLPTKAIAKQSMLDLDKMYQWEVSLVCDPRNRELDWRTSRWIQRVEPSDINTSLDEELQTATPLEQVVLYGKAGIWHDALMALADLRQTQGDSTVLVSLWDDLLNSEAVQLGRVTQAPLLDCCQAIQEDGNQN